MPRVSEIRQAAVAGSFYPQDAQALAREVDEFLRASEPVRNLPAARMLLSPHAGYTYSGAIAGRGFARAAASHTLPTRAFIISPSHFEVFGYSSVYGGGAYRTPLGDVRVDTDCARALTRVDSSVRVSGAGHGSGSGQRGEHGIEVQLPFLQRAFPEIVIVPVVMGSQSWAASRALGRAIASVVEWSRDIVIASSDLSHFHFDQRARELDEAFCEALKALDARALHDRVARGECEACGAAPVEAALVATEALANRSAEILARGNSGDISHDRTSVVGYVSAVVSGDAS